MNIGKVAKLTELSAKQIRDYEKAGLLAVATRSYSGYRQYSAQDIIRLQFISNARKVGFSLKQIAELLKLNDNCCRTSREVKTLTEKHILELKAKIMDLEKMVAQLESWHSACEGNDNPDCSILKGLQLQPQNG